jgi:hypothetical protein
MSAEATLELCLPQYAVGCSGRIEQLHSNDGLLIMIESAPHRSEHAVAQRGLELVASASETAKAHSDERIWSGRQRGRRHRGGG